MQDKKASIKFIEKCYKLYEQKMYQVAYRILHDSGQAEDAVQEAFLKMMKSSVYFEDAESEHCKRYIITVIKHASINIYNKNRKEQEVLCFSDNQEMFEDTYYQNEISDADNLKELISELPSKYYVVVNCLVIQNLSVKETANELHISEVNVRKRFERAKVLLKSMVKGRMDYEKGKNIYKSGIS